MCIDKDTIILFGGMGKNDVQLNDLWSYSIPSNTWTKLFEFVQYPYLSHHTSIIINHVLYLIGSKSVTTCDTNLTENFLSLFCIDLQTGKCVCKSDSSNSKSSYSFVSFDGPEPCCFYAYYLLGDRFRCVKQPCNRSSPSAFLFNIHIILAGGYSSLSFFSSSLSITGDYLSDIWDYDPKTGNWDLLYYDMDCCRISPGCSISMMNRYIIFYGG